MNASPSIEPGFLALVASAHALLNDRPKLLSRWLIACHRSEADRPPMHWLRNARTLLESLARMSVEPARGEAALAWLSSPGRALLHLGHPAYPPLLAEIPDPPPVLYVEGALDILSSPQVAVVGSRRAGASGRQNAFELAEALARSGLTITSGLANGIDAAAHEGALAGAGATVAVLGSGIDQCYPRSNFRLAARIAAQGALVSEFPLGTRPTRYSFPRRNRIISGLSLGTLVVEAAENSGSLITAMAALEQGRDVFAVPGSIRNPLTAGCHRLLREGAVLTACADDVLAELGLSPSTQKINNQDKTEGYDFSPQALRVLRACAFEPTPFASLVAGSQLTPPEVSSILTALEIQGVVRAEPGGQFVLLKPVPERS